MALIQISFGDIDTAFEISDADALRILQAYVPVYTTTDPQTGQPVVPTPTETVHYIAQSVVTGLANFALRSEKEAAGRAASDSVPPIDVTIVPTAVP